MRATILILSAALLGACSQSADQKTRADAERTREQARETAEQVRRESRVALHNAEVDARKAGREIDQGLEKTREKVRRAVDAHPDHTSRNDNDRP